MSDTSADNNSAKDNSASDRSETTLVRTGANNTINSAKSFQPDNVTRQEQIYTQVSKEDGRTDTFAVLEDRSHMSAPVGEGPNRHSMKRTRVVHVHVQAWFTCDE